MTQKKLEGPGITLRAEVDDDRHAWITSSGVPFFKTLSVRITKGSYGLVDEKYDPLSTTVEFHFNKNGDLCMRQGQELNPYLNRILVTPPMVRIPTALLKFKSYSIYTESNLYGDFVYIWGEQKRRIHFFGFNVSAIGLFDGVDEVRMNGTFSMFGAIIGELRLDHRDRLLPFLITGEVGHGEQFELFKEFTEQSYPIANELGHRVDFMDNPMVTQFLSINMGVGHDRAPTSKSDGVFQARKVFNTLFHMMSI